MKLVPISFMQVWDGETSPVWKSFRREDGGWAFERRLVMTPGQWNAGWYVRFELVEKYRKKDEGGVCEEEIQRWDFKDVSVPDSAYFRVQSMIRALECGDARGEVAEHFAVSLYERFLAKNDEFLKQMPGILECSQKLAAINQTLVAS